MDSQARPGSRVFQLESSSLNREFNKIVEKLVEDLDISAVSDEIKLAAKLYMATNYLKDRSSIGMSIYNLNYYELGQGDKLKEPVGNYKLILLTACNIVLPYLMKKLGNSEEAIRHNYFSRLKFSWLTLDNACITFKSLSIVNFFLFLQQGRYPLFQERLLGLVPGMSEEDYINNMSLNKVQMELLNRDVVWKTLVEFISVVIPYINFTQMKNKALKFTGLMPGVKTEVRLSDKLKRMENCKKCAICSKQPFNPFIIGCSHVFCYYCLQTNHQIDKSQGYNCPLCNYNTKDDSHVQRYKIHVLAQLNQ